MFERKLEALEFHSPLDFDYQDEMTFRNFISWIENQKIRLYKIEEREKLDNVGNDEEWRQGFAKYLVDLGFKHLDVTKDRAYIIEQLLSHAIRLEYSDNIVKYNLIGSDSNHFNQKEDGKDYLEAIDYSSSEFKQGLEKVQRLLNVPSKLNDATSILQALAKLISEKLNPNAVQTCLNEQRNLKNETEINVVNIIMENVDLGFDTNDKILNDVAKILRLLHIKELRDLQTKINETIALIQGITANPKTDSSLGRVGK